MPRITLCLIVLLTLLSLLSGCTIAEPSGAGDVRVTLTEFGVDASTRTFVAGVPYRLRITNRGKVNHELRITPPGDQSGPAEIVSVDQMALQPGGAQSIDVTFPESAKTTGLELACHLPAHYEFGMHLAVTVR